MNKQQQIIKIRTRKLGLLMYDARTAARRSLEETSVAIGVSPQELQAYEKGEKAPSLPVLEAFAFFLDVPIEHFWSNDAFSGKVEEENLKQKERLRRLRDRIIGASLRMHRTNLNFSFQEVSNSTGLAEDQLERFEKGEEAPSLPELELLAKTFDVRIEDFFDQKGPIGTWRAQQIAIQRFLELPADLQNFVSKPINKPYLDLAIRLSDLSVEKLRGIAEGLLEITY